MSGIFLLIAAFDNQNTVTDEFTIGIPEKGVYCFGLFSIFIFIGRILRLLMCDVLRSLGINTLISIMSKFGNSCEKQSSIMHNERLEFLGDAVIEFITSIHLYHLFPEIEEGGLATYRAAIVQNQHLTLMALVRRVCSHFSFFTRESSAIFANGLQELELHQYMLFAHGSDLCHDLELRHAMANCFEALLGALYLDGGLEVCIFSNWLNLFYTCQCNVSLVCR